MSLFGAILKQGAKFADEAFDASKMQAKQVDEVFDEAAWLAENPRPHPDVRPKDMTEGQMRAYNLWKTKKYQAKNRDKVLQRERDKYAGDEEYRERKKARARRSGKTQEEVEALRSREREIQNERYATDEEYREKIKKKNRRARSARAEKDPDGERERRRKAAIKHRDKDPVRFKAKKAADASKRRNRAVTPPHADVDEINEIHHIAGQIRSLTEMPWEVDHVIPYQGRKVTGFNHPDNLLIIPREQNRSKGAAFPPGDLPPAGGVQAARSLLEEVLKSQGR